MENSHEGHRERLRAKVEAGGLLTFQQHEVLELLLTFSLPRQDVNPLAHLLIDRFGTIEGVLSAPRKDLLAVRGVGPKTVRFFHTLKAIEDALAQGCRAERVRLQNPLESKEYLRTFLHSRPAGVLWQFNLDLNGRLICCEAICAVREFRKSNVRQLSQSALDCGAKAVLLAARLPRAASFGRGRIEDAVPGMRAYLERLSVYLAECYFFVGEDVYDCRAENRRAAQPVPRGAQYAAVFREHPRREENP